MKSKCRRPDSRLHLCAHLSHATPSVFSRSARPCSGSDPPRAVRLGCWAGSHPPRRPGRVPRRRPGLGWPPPSLASASGLIGCRRPNQCHPRPLQLSDRAYPAVLQRTGRGASAPVSILFAFCLVTLCSFPLMWWAPMASLPADEYVRFGVFRVRNLGLGLQYGSLILSMLLWHRRSSGGSLSCCMQSL